MISGRFPSGLPFFRGLPWNSSRTPPASSPSAGISVSSRDWVRLPADDRSHRTLPFARKRVATEFWVRPRPISSLARPVGWHFEPPSFSNREAFLDLGLWNRLTAASKAGDAETVAGPPPLAPSRRDSRSTRTADRPWRRPL